MNFSQESAPQRALFTRLGPAMTRAEAVARRDLPGLLPRRLPRPAAPAVTPPISAEMILRAVGLA